MELTEQVLAERQHILDIAKWIASEQAGYDLCGTLPFCPYCNKEERHPCARAEVRFRIELEAKAAIAEEEQAALEAPAEPLAEALEEAAFAEAAPAEEEEAELPAGYEYVTRYRRTFRARLIQNEKAQNFYGEVRNALSALDGVKARVSQACENFRFRGKRLARLAVGGKTLVLYLALDPKLYEDTKYRFDDVSDRKTYAETPMKVRITSKRMAKYARELITELAKTHGVALQEVIPADYSAPYETDAALIQRGLIKPYRALVKKRR